MRYFKSHFAASIITALFTIAANAATDFITDQVVYDTNTGIVTLLGNTEIQTDEGYFYLEKLEYHTESERITVSGNVRALLKSGEIILADFATLNQGEQSLIMQQAKIWLTNRMQIAANYASDTPDATYGEQITASTCHVCRIHQTPLWQIRAAQIVRDKPAKKIYFKNAWFDVAGVPIGYLPYLRVPDPNATSMSGFLPIKLIFSNLYITGIRVPYYWAISDHSDLTTTIYLTTTNIQIAEAEYRHEIKGGSIKTTGAFSINDGKGEFGRYYLTNHINLDRLPFELNFESEFTLQSDYDFHPKFYDENPRRDYITLSRFSANHSFDATIANYRPVSEAAKNLETQTIRPSLSYQYYRQMGKNGQIKFDVNSLILDRDLSEDVARLTSSLEFQHKSVWLSSFAVETKFGLRYNFYEVGNNPIGENGRAERTTPYGAIDISLPLSKQTAKAQHLLVPRVQFVWSENYDNGVDIPNTDSLFVEHDYISLFTENRFIGSDRHERGLRANMGLSYAVHNLDQSSFEIGLGSIWRQEDTLALEGFRDARNEWVGFLSYNSPQIWSAYLRGAFDGNFEFSRSEVGVEYKTEKLDYSLDWVALAPEPEIGFDDYRSELLFAGRYHFQPNWESKWSFRHDLVNSEAIDGKITLTYGNECIEINAGLVFDFENEPGIEDEIRFEFDIDLLGVSKPTNEKWGKRQCMS